MYKHLVFAALCGVASCGRLDSQYLPPNQAGNQYQGTASGNNKNFERGPNADIPILKLDSQNEGDGNYQYAFETGNGIQAQQQGSAQEGAGTQSQGSYSYTSPEGEQIQISYQAGENGFQPQGSHIPTAPPVPPEIQKAIEQNLADEAQGIVDDGQYKPEYQGGFQQKNQFQGGNGGKINQYIPPQQPSSGKNGYKY